MREKHPSMAKSENYPSKTAAKTLHENTTTITCSKPSKIINQNHHTKSSNSKCLVYLLALFVVFCLALLVFSSVVIRIKPPKFTITSVSIKSFIYNFSPSFNLTLVMTLSIKNPNFGHFQISDQSLNTSLVGLSYDSKSIIVGDAKLGFKSDRILARGEEEVRVELKAGTSNSTQMEDKERLYNYLNSGYLELTSFATLKGKVHLLKNKLKKKTVAVMKCYIGIDLKKSLVQKLTC